MDDRHERKVNHDLTTLRTRLLRDCGQGWNIGGCIRQEIERISNQVVRTRCLKKFEDAVCDMPVDHLEYSKRYSMLTALGDVLDTVQLREESRERVYLRRVRFLARLRREVEKAGLAVIKPGTKNLHDSPTLREQVIHDDYVKLVSLFLESSVRRKEWDLALDRRGELTVEEYARVKVAFEKVLGRPLRTVEEIERDLRRRDMERKRMEDVARGGPDIKVNADDL